MSFSLKPGENCWRIEHADRLRFIIDGADYFDLFRKVLMRARHSVYIVSWDIDSRVQLVRGSVTDGYPTALGDLLNYCAKKKPDLHIYVLNWDFSMILAMDREWLPIYKLDWKTHKRVHFALNSYQPSGASQHQKIVAIDDEVAFIGGLDITMGRWDTPDHKADNEKRDRIDNRISRPYHDVQVMVSGDAAASLADLARDQWKKATGKSPHGPVRKKQGTLWPDNVKPDIEDIDIALARTQAKYRKQAEIREIQEFYRQAIRDARDYIYIENQYFTAPAIADAIQEKLEKKEGPEIVMVFPKETAGWLSQFTMDVLRVRLIRRLRKHDTYNRITILYPESPDLGDVPINVHAKVMIIDDRIATVGSANLNNRSMGLDNECNLFVDSQSQEHAGKGIRLFRSRLLAEHLGTSTQVVDDMVKQKKSLRQSIDELTNTDRRYLKALPLDVPEDIDRVVPDTDVVDPEHPIKPELIVKRLVPEEDHKPARKRIVTWLFLIAFIAGLSAMWRWTPLSEWVNVDTLSTFISMIRDIPAAPALVVAGFVLAGFIAFPFSLLIIATVLAFGSVQGFILSLIGGTLSALIIYYFGDLLGRSTVRRLAGSRLNNISKTIARHGVITIVAVRIIPVAPFSVVNLVAGASHINFRDYFIGTMLGMTPGMLAVTVIADRVYATVKNPEPENIMLLIMVVLVIAIAGFMLVRWLRRKSKE